MLWIEVQSSAEEKDCNSKVFKRSVASTDGFDLLDFAVACFGIGLFMTKSIADAVKMSFEHLCNLDHFRYSCILNTGKPEFKVRLCFGEGVTFKNPLEFFA